MLGKKFFKPIGLIDFVVLISFVALSLLQFSHFADDPGVGWHLKTGEWIAQNGGVPRSDPFLFYPNPRAWISDQWLSDALLFFIYDWGGYPLLYATLSSLFFLTFYVVLYLALIDSNSAALAACSAAFIAMKLGSTSFLLRPVIFSFALFTSTVWISFRLYQQFSPTSKRNPHTLRRSIDFRRNKLNRLLVLLLIPIFALWANMHPSFPLGVAVLVVLSVALAWERFTLNVPINESRVAEKGIIVALFGTLLALVGSMINPYGIELHRSIVSLVNNNYFMGMNLEWRPPSYSSSNFLFITISLSLVILLWALRGRRFVSTFEILLLGVFGYLSFTALRYSPYLGVVSAFPLARLLSFGVVSRTSKWYRLMNLFLRLERRERMSYGGAVIFPLTAYSLILALFFGRVPFYRGNFGPAPENYPYAAVKFLNENQEVMPGSGVIAPVQWGGFVIFNSEGKLKPLVDDRNTMIGEEFYREFYRRFGVGGDWKEYLQERGVTLILVPNGSRFEEANRGKGVIFEDQVAVVMKVE